MADKNSFDRYLLALRKTPLHDQTEYTPRSAMEDLLEALVVEFETDVTVHQETRRQKVKVKDASSEKGAAPDFKVIKRGLILGYVETKPIGENLDKALKSEQIAKYRELSKNIVLTDYLHFIWISENSIQREILCHPTDLENPKFKLKEDRAEAVAKMLQGFFSSAPEGIGRAQQLALALATRSRLLRDYLGEELVRQGREKKGERLYGLFQIFQKQVFHDLELKEFADAFAQMLAYGLFLAKLNSEAAVITLRNARDFIPGSFQLIRELVDFLPDLEKDEYRDIRWVVEEILSIVNGLKLAEIQSDLSFRQRKAISRNVKAKDEEEHRLFERDPFIYFYEDYLREYDSKMRESRGVYYTPPPVVNFIVRAIDDILRDKKIFNIKDGLADHKKVTVLDFACGTGTFLLEIFQRILENIGGSGNARAGLLVQGHILKNLFGFEYLIAPYTISHLKLSQFLEDKGHKIEGDRRLQVYLTNTLEPVEPQANFLLPSVSAEVKAAQTVKDKKILVITGNPPYSGISRNMGKAAQALIEKYKYVDGAHFGERKHWLQDDYVKFLAFAQNKMADVTEGVIAVITNHQWLENVTFRGMRQSLIDSFEQIYILDLHGSSKKDEPVPPGLENENVFDIEQGVAISIFVKGNRFERRLLHLDIWGNRLEKYSFLASSSLTELNFTKLKPTTPNYLLRPVQTQDSGYNAFLSLQDIFSVRSTGIQTSRDQLVIAFNKTELTSRMREFVETSFSDQYFREKYFRESRTGKYPRGDTRGWNVPAAREWARKNFEQLNKSIGEISYRPFDTRQLIIHDQMIDWPRSDVMQHIIDDNIALLVPRQLAAEGFRHAFCVDKPSEMCVISTKTKEQNYVFPLWLYAGEKKENIGSEARSYIDGLYEEHFSPEEIAGYVYAVLYSTTYRSSYSEFLRLDFPRIPFPSQSKDFEKLSGLGWALIEAHLLRQLPRKNLAAYHGKADHTVEFVRYSPEDKSIAINKTQFFKPVPEHVWNFHIGGYQVLDKYLKSRKGRQLSLDEINQVSAVADSLAFSIEQMAKIDKAYKAAFPSGG